VENWPNACFMKNWANVRSVDANSLHIFTVMAVRSFKAMKSDIHPDYRPVVFKDKNADFAVLTGSTIRTKETIQWEDGNEYPVYYVDISSESHPFYTGKQQFVDTLGRVEKFKQKFAGKYGQKKDKKK
jgi:large subunit ribosomal protein L31